MSHLRLALAPLLLSAAFALPAGGEQPAAPGPEAELPGVPLVRFDRPVDLDAWRIVKDAVMGGRSEGDLALDGGVLTFAGDINTNGGGFFSAYHLLPEGILDGTDRVLLRVWAVDDRPYRVNFRDSRSGRVLHRFDLPITEPGVWETVEVRYADLVPSLRGDPRDLPRFEPSLATEIGLILNDTGDGAFELRVSGVSAAGVDAGDGAEAADAG